MKVYEGARSFDAESSLLLASRCRRATASSHLAGIRPGTDGSNPSPSSGESQQTFGFN
jgi:hypothetical protein